MKVKPQSPPAVKLPRQDQPPKAASPTAKTPEAAGGWRPRGVSGASAPAALHAAQQALAAHATAAVVQQTVARSGGPAAPQHPMLEAFGKAAGLGLGVVVTEALALLPSWNKPVLDAAGKPVASVEGANRVGNHDILKRHQEVVGPKVLALVQKMKPGAIHDLLEGFGKGGSEAPGDSYRLEAAVSDLLHKR